MTKGTNTRPRMRQQGWPQVVATFVCAAVRLAWEHRELLGLVNEILNGPAEPQARNRKASTSIAAKPRTNARSGGGLEASAGAKTAGERRSERLLAEQGLAASNGSARGGRGAK